MRLKVRLNVFSMQRAWRVIDVPSQLFLSFLYLIDKPKHTKSYPDAREAQQIDFNHYGIQPEG